MDPKESLDIIIMAGGEGKRMQSEIPKVLVKLNNYPMIVHILRELETFRRNIHKIYIVVGKHRDIIKNKISEYNEILPHNFTKIEYVNQETPLGTGDAIKSCKKYLKKSTEDIKKYSLILSGDVPLITNLTLLKLYDSCVNNNYKASLIATKFDNPFGYGRIVKHNKRFMKIVEEKDCNESEKQINDINTGIYLFENDIILNYIDKLTCNNAQNEYYLTEIFDFLIKDCIEVNVLDLNKKQSYEIMGVNTIEQLKELERIVKEA
jgi:UDP-N-acetylglucosamine diphosphorylase/glucosamine-1-phosphate N-acetyltransferase